MTAPKPATGLPLLVNDDDILYPLNGCEDGQDWIADCRASPRFAGQIAARCNAYPQLVAALRDLFEAPSGNPAADRIANAAAWERARALLRSLGEL